MSQTVDDFENNSRAILAALRSYIDEEFGEPCTSFDDGCPTCAMWGLFASFKQAIDVPETSETRSDFIKRMTKHWLKEKGPDVPAEAL